MNIPEDLKYTEDHEWIRVTDGEVLVGVTDFAQTELGDVVFVEIDQNEDEIAKGDIFGTIEAVKTVSDLFMPISGKIIEINDKLESEPELVNQDPYGEGWMIKVQVTRPEELDELIGSDGYKELIGN
ncbi:MAG: glycine cleavage system protein GcvH [Bacteroidetes bacterium]|nr:glycine cleavage system protein GcvH [Bacteroidota bacterium]